MARAGSTTIVNETCFFRSDRAAKGNAVLGTTSGISNPGDGPPFKVMRVNCDSASAVATLVRIPFLHGYAATTNQVTIAAGQYREFICVGMNGEPMGDELYLGGSAGTATFSFEVIG